MNHLMFVKTGVIRKFLLLPRPILIGRSPDCDIVLDDHAISKKHCRVEAFPDHILISDLRSRNGTFVDGERIHSARIMMNNSFGIGETEFFFKKGHIKEFAISRELSGAFSTLARAKRLKRGAVADTTSLGSRFASILPLLVEKAVIDDDLGRFVQDLRAILPDVLTSGFLFFMRQREPAMLLYNREEGIDPRQFMNRLGAKNEWQVTMDDRTIFLRLFRCPKSESFLLYGASDPLVFRQPALVDFLEKLAEIVSLNLRIVPVISFDPLPLPLLFESGGIRIIGKSPALKRLVDIAAKVAPKPTFMLIMGESGTGKELIARLIHHLSGRKKYVAINCAAIPLTLLESELFGHEAGAFTDARQRKIGRIEDSSGGTLVLDEIGDMPLDIQAKLLRVIAEKSVTRLGSNEVLPVDLRIIAMTNHDIYRLVEAKQFRRDLFFRLRVHEMIVPPLRERREDIPALVMHFSRLYGEQNQVAPAGFSQSVQECFDSYDWSGNVRELENEIRKIIEIIEDGEVISDHHLTQSIIGFSKKAPPPGPQPAEVSFQEKMAGHERGELLELLERCAGNKAQAARTLGVTYQALWKKMKKLGLK